MRQVAFVVVTSAMLALALACGEREEYKGSGSKSLVDPTAEGGVVISSSSSGGTDGSIDAPIDGSEGDALPDVFVVDSSADVKEGG